MEAVKQGSATVGLKSKTHAILVALKVLFFFIFIIKYILILFSLRITVTLIN